MISIVSPFYNEKAILEASVRLMLKNLAALDEDWELIVVNDGSTDGSPEIARRLAAGNDRLKVVSYTPNRGRGYAIRTGVGEARGEIVVTTEIDSSWGDDIVPRIVATFRARPDADIVIASPHMPGGGYRNVPRLRVFL
ncbi:MAG: glycosyltransferase family 2 protein, partial [Planctomycetes bacterium]|nr:glycosyltransferase family 2 protein [Planctomycetota bacterium]